MKLSVVAAAVAFSLIGLSSAQDARAFMKKPTNIPAQPLGDALKELANTRELQLLYVADMLGDARTSGARGVLTAPEALWQLLNGTNFTFRYLDDDTITIARVATQASVNADSGEATSERLPVSEKPPMSEVVVTGSRLLSVEAEGAVPLRSITAKEIAQSGQGTLGQFLSTLPEVSTAFTESISESQGGLTTVQLHGLPAGTTLVLLNGKRLESGGASTGKFFDLNSIPVGAIERVEIIPVGSSAVYGSDALAGVVNVILKTDFDGAQVNTRYGAASGVWEKGLDAAWGNTWDHASFSIVGSFFERSGLGFGERAISADNDYRRFGGADRRVSICNPGTVSTTNGANLPGLSSPRAAMPAGITGTARREDFIPTAGTTNLCSYYANYYALPSSERYGGVASLNVDLGRSMKLFAEVDYSRVEQGLNTGPQTLNNIGIGANNPYNPFGVPLTMNYRLADDAEQRRTGYNYSTFTRPVLGLEGTIGSDWSWEAAVWQARDRVAIRYDSTVQNTAAIRAAMNSTDPATAFNPFTSGAPASPEVLAGMWDPFDHRYDSKANLANAFVRGRLLDLPAGPLGIVVGGEFNRSSLEYATQSRGASYSRKERSAFAEARIPILDRGDSEDDLLTFSTAVRYDHSSDYGGNTATQFGLELRPLPTLLLRASFAEAYRAPALDALFQDAVIGCTTPCINVLDPKRNNASTAILYTSGGNPDLVPESGESRSVGFVWDNAFVENLRTSLTFWSVMQENRVTKPSFQTIVDNEDLFPGFVTRAPSVNGAPGQITWVTYNFLNFGKMEVEGLDWQTSYRYRAGWGELSPALGVTYTTKYSAALLPNAPARNRLDLLDPDGWSPKLKGTASLGYRQGALSAGVTVRHTGDYRDIDNIRSEGPYTFVDLSLGYDFAGLSGFEMLSAKSLEIRLGAVNVTDELPDYSSIAAYGYDPSQADLRGRFLFVRADAQW